MDGKGNEGLKIKQMKEYTICKCQLGDMCREN
jgi:hypothetical protein